MKKAFVSLFAIVTVITLVLSLLTGCGGGSAKEPDDTGTAGTSEGTVKATSDNKGQEITLTLATSDNYYAPASYVNNLPVFQEIEKKTGIKIKWDVTPSAQYQTAMQTRFAAGSDLPDIVNMNFADIGQYSANGMLIPLEKYLTEENAPNAMIRFKENPFMEKLLYSVDNHIYQISGLRGKMELEGNCYSFAIRKDWLDNAGQSVPQNLDEFYNVLKAFKENDVNGNGDKSDEIPFSEEYGTVALLGNSFGLHIFYNGGFSDTGDGKIQYDFVQDNYKNYLMYLNKLYSEELLDNEFATITGDQINAKVARNLIGCKYAWGNQVIEMENNLKSSGVPDGKYVQILPLKGYEGKDSYIETWGLIDGCMSVTKDCKYPEEAVRLLDYMVLSEDARYLMNAGIEGMTYNKNSNGEVEFTDFVLKNPDGLTPYEALRSIGAWPTTPFVLLKDASRGIYKDRPDLVEFVKKMEPYIADRIEFSKATSEESEQESGLQRDITTYVKEMQLKFITGGESFDNWDKYISQMNELGVDKLVKIKQQQYDRLK